MTTDKIIDKLQKLQAKASSAEELGNEAEALAFAMKVQELMDRHKLDMSVLTLKQQDKDEPLGATWVNNTRGGKDTRSGWVEHLADAVMEAYYCRFMVVPGTDTIIIVGRKTDREVAEFVLMRLIIFINAEAIHQHGALRYRLYHNNDGDMSEAHGFKAAFRRAAVATICTRLRELREEAVASSSSMALVVQRSKEEVNELFDDLTEKASSTKMQRGSNAIGSEAGRQAGNRADISGGGLRKGDTSKRLR